MEILKHLFGAVLLLAGVLIVFASYARQWRNFKHRNSKDAQWSSPAPFVGPMFIIAGYSMLPIEFSDWIFWVIVLDPDTVITILRIPWLIKGFRE